MRSWFKTPRPNSEDEVRIVEALQSWGIDAKIGPEGVEPNRGKINTTSLQDSLSITHHQVEDLTSPQQRAFNERETPIQWLTRLRETRQANRFLPCFEFLPCKWQPGCCQSRTSWIPPRIDWDIKPTRILRARACLNPGLPWRGCSGIEGEFEVEFFNKSQEGEQVRTTTCKCQGGSSGTRRTPISGSATLDENDSQHVTLPELNNEFLAKLNNEFRQIKPNITTTSVATFKKTGVWNLIKSLYDVWVHKSTSVQAEIETTITYQWFGQTNRETRKISFRARIPIADLEYDLDCCIRP